MSVLATDNFNRADANPIGGNWSVGGSGTGFKIVSNQAIPIDINADCNAYYNAITWPNDQYSQVVVTTGSSGGGSGPGLVARSASGAATRYRLAVSTVGSNNIELAKEVAGSYTSIWTRTSAFTNGNVCRLEAQGATLRAFNAGVQVGADSTDSSIASGNAGLIYSSTQTGAAVDDWEGGNFSSSFTWQQLVQDFTRITERSVGVPY